MSALQRYLHVTEDQKDKAAISVSPELFNHDFQLPRSFPLVALVLIAPNRNG